jgi:putative FmdB family regulatory protein
MPTYKMVEFQCPECEHIFEMLLNKEEENPVCPKCNNPNCFIIIGNPQHHKHVSHSQWRIGHAD